MQGGARTVGVGTAVASACFRRRAKSAISSSSSTCASGYNCPRSAQYSPICRPHRSLTVVRGVAHAKAFSSLPRCLGDVRCVTSLTAKVDDHSFWGTDGESSNNDGSGDDALSKGLLSLLHEPTEDGGSTIAPDRKGGSNAEAQSSKSDSLPDPGDGDDEASDPPRYQSRKNSELLFASFAPHVDKVAMSKLRNRLNKFVKSVKRSKKHYDETHQRTGTGRLKGELNKMIKNANLGSNGRGGRMEMLSVFVDDLLKTAGKYKATNSVLSPETHAWMKPPLLHFFANRQLCDKTDDNDGGSSGTGIRSPFFADGGVTLSDPSFPPNVNRNKIEEKSLVEILTKARERCLGPDPLFWSKKKAKSSARSQARREKVLMKRAREKEDDASVSSTGEEESTITTAGSDLKRSRINILRARHAEKTPEELRCEAEAMAQLLADRLPSISFERLTTELEVYAHDHDDDDANSNLSESGNTELSKSSKRRKKNRTRRILTTILRTTIKDHMHLVAADIAEFLYVGIPETIREKDAASASAEVAGCERKKYVHSFDDRINAAWVEWTQTRDQIVTAFMEAQHVMVDVENMWRKEMERRVAREASERNDEGVENMFTKLKSEAEREDLIRKLQATMKRKGPHAVFDAMLLNERFSTASDNATAETECTVLVDCLPIDVTDAEVKELYSRCGPIKAVRIFNNRPDLDPGPPTPAQLIKQRKKRRRAGAKQLKQNAERKRSPVYAMVTFESEEGCKMASIDQLRIFGMVIRRHPARTIRAQDATTLHLENIPEGLYSLDLEQKLSRALHPDMYIGLDVGQNDYGKPASCEIRFPNFEAAFHAFTILEQINMSAEMPVEENEGAEDEVPQCVLHWMKTPADAVGHWTRQLCFDE